MCQVLMLTNAEKLKNQKRVIKTIARHLLSTQRDGFGYAFLGAQGVYGEKTTKREFNSKTNIPLNMYPPSECFKATHSVFGRETKNIGGALFHGRTSTNDHTIENTHPLQKNNWTLIHNGVVSNKGPDYVPNTTNDTEHILEHLSTEGIKAVEKYISGYYAVGAFDPNGNLHVIKDATARLYVANNKTLNCLIFGTTEELIKNVAKDCQWVIGPIEQVKDNIHLIFSPEGSLIHSASITSLGYEDKESRWASQSLGYSLKDDFTQWRDEIKNVDASYTFFDWNNRPMDYKEFILLDEVTKADCLVIRPDGTVVDPEDYYTERLG